MKNYIRCFCAVFLFLFFVGAANSQEKDSVAFLRVAPLFGRGGVAISQAVYFEVNPVPWFGAGVMAGRSGVSGYQDQGATTDASDFSSGIVLVGRFPKAIKHFRFGGFVQSVYNGSHVSAQYSDTYPDGNGGFVNVQGNYYASDRDPIVTVGANVEYYIPHGPPLLIRVGRNFGDGLAANTAGGFYFVVGPMVDPTPFFKKSGKLLLLPFRHH